MGKYVSKCVESVNMIGPSPKVMVCPFCHRRRWRHKATVYSFKTNGCVTCRITRKYTNLNSNDLTSDTLLAEPKQKCSGRYLVEIPLDDTVNTSEQKYNFSSLYAKYGNKTHNPVTFKL